MGSIESQLTIACVPCGFLRENHLGSDDKFSGYESSTSIDPGEYQIIKHRDDEQNNFEYKNYNEKNKNSVGSPQVSHSTSDPYLRSHSSSVDRATKSILKRTSSSSSIIHNSASMPNLRSLSSDQVNNPRRTSIRFSSDKPSMVRIDSHKQLSKAERLSIYYDHDDMKLFIKTELNRRAKKGITSMSALTPNSDDTDDDFLEF
mmetsp:Transcript_36986/g.47801  ORF Transcript_36986/g.47801 Transcript_36986/m.47801 type:complete len:203 (-) Transcript_36986:355-963(-)